MKCEAVQDLAADYREGALPVADELCIDIHLIQCEHCRAELDALEIFTTLVASDIEDKAPGGSALDLLDRLDEAPPARAPYGSSPKWTIAGPVLQVTAVLAVMVWACWAGLAGLTGEPSEFFGGTTADAGHPFARAWALPERAEPGLVDLEALGLRGGEVPRADDGEA